MTTTSLSMSQKSDDHLQAAERSLATAKHTHSLAVFDFTSASEAFVREPLKSSRFTTLTNAAQALRDADNQVAEALRWLSRIKQIAQHAA